MMVGEIEITSGGVGGDNHGGVGDPAPEIDPTTGMAALTLLADGVLIMRRRRENRIHTLPLP